MSYFENSQYEVLRNLQEGFGQSRKFGSTDSGRLPAHHEFCDWNRRDNTNQLGVNRFPLVWSPDQILEQDPKSLAFQTFDELPFSDVRLLVCKSNNDWEIHNLMKELPIIRLDVRFLGHLARNQHLIPEHWKNTGRVGLNGIKFPGTFFWSSQTRGRNAYWCSMHYPYRLEDPKWEFMEGDFGHLFPVVPLVSNIDTTPEQHGLYLFEHRRPEVPLISHIDAVLKEHGLKNGQ